MVGPCCRVVIFWHFSISFTQMNCTCVECELQYNCLTPDAIDENPLHILTTSNVVVLSRVFKWQLTLQKKRNHLEHSHGDRWVLLLRCRKNVESTHLLKSCLTTLIYTASVSLSITPSINCPRKMLQKISFLFSKGSIMSQYKCAYSSIS